MMNFCWITSALFPELVYLLAEKCVMATALILKTRYLLQSK